MSAPTDLDRCAGVFEEISPEAWRRGTELAIEMFNEADLDEAMSVNADEREGRAQNNLVFRYLLRLRQVAGEDQHVEMAFCSILTEFIATACGGSCYDVDGIEHLARRVGPVPQAVQP